MHFASLTVVAPRVFSSDCVDFFDGYGGGVFLRRGFRVFSVGVAVLVVVQLSDECVCAVSVPLERLSSRRTKGLSPRFVLAELLLFRELQTIVSAVAFA